MGKFSRWVGARAKEPTTWTGLAMIAVTVGVDPKLASNLAHGIALVVGGALVGVNRDDLR